MSVPDNELPIWTIAPNWADGITETLEWLTQVLDDAEGNEQRVAMRLSPRRRFEVQFNPLDEERSYFDLWLHRHGGEEFMVPLWHDRAPLTAAIAAGVTVLPIDNTYREHAVGNMVLVIGRDAFTYDVGTITAMDAVSLTIDTATANAWGTDAVVHPLRRTRLSDETALAAITSRLGEATLQFDLNQANDLSDEGAWGGLTHDDLPVLTAEPNRRETIDLSFLRKAESLDNDQGLRHLADEADRAFTIQTHHWLAAGRQEQFELRQLLYRLRGMQNGIWVPTFNRDMRLARAAAAVDGSLDIRRIGYEATGGVSSGRSVILIDGATVAEIAGTAAPLAADEERLTLGAAVGADFSAGTSASFLEAMRLAQDSIEIHHHADSDGACEARASFRAFRNERVAPAVLDYPIATAAISIEPCGTVPIDSECVDNDVFDPWYLKVRYVVTDPLSGGGATFLDGNPDFYGGQSISNTTTEADRPVSRTTGLTEDGRPYEEYTFYAEPPEGVDWFLDKQHDAGSAVSPRAYVEFRRRGGTWTRVTPYAGDGIDAQTAVDGTFFIYNTFPHDHSFIF